MPQGGAPPAQTRGQATGVLPAEVVERARRQTHPPYSNPHIYPEYSGRQPNPHLPGHDAQFFARTAGHALDHSGHAHAPPHGAVPADNDRGSSSRGMSQHDYSFNEQRQR